MSEAISPARAAAAYVLSRCRRFDAWAPQTLAAAREKYKLSDRDAALCERMCLSVLQNAALCDFYIGSFSSVPVSRMQPDVLDALRLGTVQILFMDRIPVSAAVDQSVAMVKKTSRGAAGLVNAVLRRIAENRTSLPPIPDQDTAMELSVRYSHPLWLCRRLTDELGYESAGAFLAADNTLPGLTVSVNLCKTDAVSLAEALRGIDIDASVNAVSAVSVDINNSGPVDDLPGFSEGLFFVQDAAAACSVLAAGPERGSHILDMCAAPGGKSLLCASVMRNEGEIVSCDLHAKKLRLIRENVDRLGFDCIQTRAMDASEPDEEYFSAFDLVIADVPCSGMGVIRKKPEIRYKDPESLKNLPSVQLRILTGAAKCVHPGGKLLYSTCTVFHEENRDVVDAFLDNTGEFSVLESRTIWPQDNGTDGFYYCLLKRNDHDR